MLIKIKIKKNKFAVYIVVGWIFTFFLGWIIGFPLELFSKSWNIFSLIYSLCLIAICLIAFLIFYFLYRDRLYTFFNKTKDNHKLIVKIIINHLKKYWIIYSFVLVFSFFSMTNLQPYTIDNYSDDSYITKMVHLKNEKSLLSESQTSGESLRSYGKFSYALQQSHRMFNTYELVYSYFSAISSIDMVFFVRFTMTIHNYLIWFLSLQLLSSIFLDSDKSQYAILPIILLLIPEGFAAKGMGLFSIRLFENWRNQTAIYMGGSIVRNTAFPLLLYFSYSFFEKKTFRGILIFPIFFILLLSYQTTGISYMLLFLPLFLFGLILDYLMKRIDRIQLNNRLVDINLSIIMFLIMIIFIVKIDGLVRTINIPSKLNFINSVSFNLRSLELIYKQYLPYYNDIFKLDFFANIALTILLSSFLFIRSKKGRIINLMILLLYLIFKLNACKLTLSLISFEYYCTARMMHGMLQTVMVMFGVLLVSSCVFLSKHIKYLQFGSKLNKTIGPLLACSMIIGVIYSIQKNMKNILKFHSAGDGVVSQGYSLKPLTMNDKMLAPVFVDVGNYFEKQSNNAKKYYVFSFDKINYGGLSYSKQNLLLASKKIEFYPDWNRYITAKEKNDKLTIDKIEAGNNANFALEHYLLGNFYPTHYEITDSYVRKANINYAFLTNKSYVKKLESHGWNVVLGNSQKKYWLLKRS